MSLTTDVRDWIAADPDPSDRAELQDLLERLEGGDDAARADLADRFSGPLEFGTAGLRGRIGAGPHRMNRAVVLRAAHGLVTWLTDEVAEDPLVVVGYDARHRSHDFALDTAAVVVAAGGRALLLPSPLPTPLLAFAVQHLGADAGVMVTASHNPKEDNGYKVYLGGRSVPEENRGSQIVPPVDGQIAQRIAAAPPAADVPRVEDGWEELDEEVRGAYLERLRTALHPPQDLPGAVDEAPEGAADTAVRPAPLRIAVTAMHGVGGTTVLRALADAGFTEAQLVPEQAEPDPEFPTVPFPNPEEPGALDLAIAFAADIGADLILAVDPDADRCAAAVPDPAAPTGWRQLSGDETGALLGEQAALAILAGDADGDAPQHRTLANSVVSSRLLAQIAEHHGLPHRVTLTGFKWISRAHGLAFGYEEAIGFCVDPDGVRDKDGISACVRLAQLTDALRHDGRGVQDELDRLALRHGVHHTAPLSIRVTDLSLIATAMDRLRSRPPAQLAGSEVTSVVDLSRGSEDLPPTDGLEYLTADGDRVVVRPSGTEPKLKCYMEVVVPVSDVPDAVPAARAAAAERMGRLRTDVQAATGM